MVEGTKMSLDMLKAEQLGKEEANETRLFDDINHSTLFWVVDNAPEFPHIDWYPEPIGKKAYSTVQDMQADSTKSANKDIIYAYVGDREVLRIETYDCKSRAVYLDNGGYPTTLIEHESTSNQLSLRGVYERLSNGLFLTPQEEVEDNGAFRWENEPLSEACTLKVCSVLGDLLGRELLYGYLGNYLAFLAVRDLNSGRGSVYASESKNSMKKVYTIDKYGSLQDCVNWVNDEL